MEYVNLSEIKFVFYGKIDYKSAENNVAMCSLCGGGSDCSCGSCGICNCGSCLGNIEDKLDLDWI